MSKKKILIVEDSSINVYILKQFLKGNDIDEALNGLKAVEMAKTSHYDIILMDLKLPGITGDIAARQIKTFSKSSLIIGITAYEKEALSDFEKESFDIILTKPVNQEQLIQLFNQPSVNQ